MNNPWSITPEEKLIISIDSAPNKWLIGTVGGCGTEDTIVLDDSPMLDLLLSDAYREEGRFFNHFVGPCQQTVTELTEIGKSQVRFILDQPKIEELIYRIVSLHKEPQNASSVQVDLGNLFSEEHIRYVLDKLVASGKIRRTSVLLPGFEMFLYFV